MAKSLRAKSHVQAKSIKRRGTFKKVEDARAERLSEKLKKDLIDQKLKLLQEKNNSEGMDVDAKAALSVKEEPKSDKKVSTSGWRNARHHDYKKARKMKKTKKNAFTKF